MCSPRFPGCLYAFQEDKGKILMQVVNIFFTSCSSQIILCSICSKHFVEFTPLSYYFLGGEEMIMPLKLLLYVLC